MLESILTIILIAICIYGIYRMEEHLNDAHHHYHQLLKNLAEIKQLSQNQSKHNIRSADGKFVKKEIVNG